MLILSHQFFWLMEHMLRLFRSCSWGLFLCHILWFPKLSRSKFSPQWLFTMNFFVLNGMTVVFKKMFAFSEVTNLELTFVPLNDSTGFPRYPKVERSYETFPELKWHKEKKQFL